MSKLMDRPAVPTGHPEAESWLELFGDRLYAYALTRVRRSHLAEDLVQETLLAAVKSSSPFENRAGVFTWLTGILKNKIADHFRSRAGNTRTVEAIPEEQALFDRRGRWKARGQEWHGDPQLIAQSHEFKTVLASCLSKLPAMATQVFVSRVVDDVQTPELCGQLNITPENAWMLLHRARLGLRECLTRNWFAESAGRKT